MTSTDEKRNENTMSDVTMDSTVGGNPMAPGDEKPKRGRGRPRKNHKPIRKLDANGNPLPKRKVGRPSNTSGMSHVDSHVGARIRNRRILLGISQERLAELLNLTFQQVQKYEKGANRISSGRLYELGKVLEVPVSYFFEEMDGTQDQPDSNSRRLREDGPVDGRASSHREALELMNAFSQIEESRVRKKILELTRSLAMLYDEENPDGPGK